MKALHSPRQMKVRDVKEDAVTFTVMFFLKCLKGHIFWFLILTACLSSCGQVVLPEIESVTKPTISKAKPVKTQIDSAYYVVQSGDTLYSIGFRSGHGYQSLADWNGIKPPYKIFVGQTLKMFDPEPVKPTLVQPPGNPGSSAQPPVEKRNWSQKRSILSNNKKKLLKLSWHWPITGSIVKSFSQSGKKGIDIEGRLGQPVKAAEAGKVVYSGTGLIGYGYLLILKHNEMYMSAYANNSQLLVEEGQFVEKGQVIASLGKSSSGLAALHFEIRKNGTPVNPLNYLPK